MKELSKMCMECVYLTNGCEGKTPQEVELRTDGKPCKNYQFNMDLLADETEQADTMFENAGVSEQVSTVIEPAADNKKAQNFARLARKRLANVLDGIRKLDNLTNPYVYEWVPEQGKTIVKAIRDAVNSLEQDFFDN